MTFLSFKDSDGIRAFASLNVPNTFKFIIDSHNYYMPSILADFLSPAVAEMHLIDPTLNYFTISGVSDNNLDFELFMLLASGRTIELTPENCPFIEIVASKLMNEEIVKIASDYLNTLSPITIENAIYRLNQKKSLGILPINEIQFIAENFWVIKPEDLFQIDAKEIQLIFSHPKLKILNEDWLFQLVLKMIKDKGETYRFLLSYISFKDLNMTTIQNFFERSKNTQIDDFILPSVQEKISANPTNNEQHKSHLISNQSEINYVYQKSKNQKNSFNFDFFNEYHLNNDQQTFDYISSLFDNSPSSSASSSIYNFNNRFNPFEPKPQKPFPDYFSRINKNKDEEKKDDENKRKPLIDEDTFPFLNWPVEIRHTDKSEQIPIHFTNKDNFSFSSSSSDDDEAGKKGNESLLQRFADQVFNTSQKIFEKHDEKEAEKVDNAVNTENHGFFTSLRNGLWSFFKPTDQKEPENIIPREEELTSFNPESIFQNRNEAERNRNNGWPSPPVHQNRDQNDNHVDANNNNNNENVQIAIHNENENNDNRIQISTNAHSPVRNNKNESDDDSLDGYGGFEKEQY